MSEFQRSLIAAPDEGDKTQRLAALARDIEDRFVCELKDQATNLVFGKGSPDAAIMFIGEAPGKKEDEQGLPFVGSAGKQLDGLLSLIGLTLEDVYIANILKYRPPLNRDPKPEEIVRHTPFLLEQIRIIKPRIVVTLGNFSTKFILSGAEPPKMKWVDGIASLHGSAHKITIAGLCLDVFPMYHPAAMLYRPQLREEIEADFRALGAHLSSTNDDKKQKV